jgi:hypothetical protein
VRQTEPDIARAIWHRIEAVNAVAYFCAEVQEALADLGYRGFWMGYFAARSAPLGQVTPATVEATFFNFHPDRVRRAVPDCWAHALPEAVLPVRAEACAAALRRLLGDAAAEDLASSVLPLLGAAVARGSAAGRPLFAANREVTVGGDVVASLWQACTTLREHRGDGHVALLTAAGLSGLEALVLFSLSEGMEASLFTASRGWSDEEWAVAVEELQRQGLVDAQGTLAAAGAELRATLEQRTDELAAQPYDVLPGPDLDRMLGSLADAAQHIEGAGEIRFPNPMGLPPLER